MAKKEKKEYQSGRIGQLVRYIATKWSLDEQEMRANLAFNFPELKDKTRCANCGGSMSVYIYSVSYLDAQLLCVMVNEINIRMKKGYTFTHANRIHRELIAKTSKYMIATRMTIASKLGLVAKVMTKNDAGEMVHDRKAGWCITKRGYDFLLGEKIPRKVQVFHNQIQEHFDDTITISEIINQPGNREESAKLAEIAGVFVETYQDPQLLEI